jgi:hypothetical protein
MMKSFVLLGVLACGLVGAEPQTSAVHDVRAHGARGDGTTLDTAAFQAAIDACSSAGGGQVRVPPGRYLTGTFELKSHVAFHLEAGARIVGTTNLAEYRRPKIPEFMPELRLGNWHRGLIIAEGAEDVSISGPGIIDGNRVFDPKGEERQRGPHTLVFVNCRRWTIRDVTFLDAANYAVFFQVSDDIDIRGVTFIGGWDGVHFRGAPQRWCRNVGIFGCRFYTGDDSIAGRYWDHTVISGCTINSSCNGIRLIGPATRLLVTDCLFYGPGQQPHRTSNRTNMLSGIILQPGAWDATQGLLDDVLLANNTMHRVASPVTVWTREGNPVNRVTLSGLEATGVYRSALSVESWAAAPITNMVVRNARIEFAGGGKSGPLIGAVQGPGVDARSLPAWGVYARNVEHLEISDVRLMVEREDARPAVFAESVRHLRIEDARLPLHGDKPAGIVTNGVTELTLRRADLAVAEAH